MLNEKQLDLGERFLVNSANVIMATMIFGTILSQRGFSLKVFGLGCILFLAVAAYAFWLRRNRFQ